jgi:hypothetical protein
MEPVTAPASPRSGRLSETPLPTLLLELMAQSFSGTLVLEHGRIEKRLQWRQGWLVLAESSRSSEGLSAFLRDSGRISQEAASKLFQQTRGRRGREVEGVRELRLLPPRELLAAVAEHVRLCALEVFAWREGGFRVEEARSVSHGPVAGVDPVALAQEGIETHWDLERTLLAFTEHQDALALPTPEFRALERRLLRDPGVQTLVAGVAERNPLGVLLQHAATPRALAAAWVLLGSGALRLEMADPAEPDRPEAAPVQFEIRVAGTQSSAALGSEREKTRTLAPGRQDEDAAFQLRAEVETKHAGLQSMDHYEVLGIARDASSTEVRRAYRDAAKRFHPDAVARLGLEDLKQQANEIFARVARANSVLSNRAQRDEYDASHSDDDQAEANRLGQAEMLFRKASIVLKAGRFTEALEFLEPCVSLWPGEAQYQTELAWALFKQPRPDLARARSHLEAALALDASAALTHYRLSLVLAALGDSQKAARARATAQRLDPRVVP